MPLLPAGRFGWIDRDGAGQKIFMRE